MVPSRNKTHWYVRIFIKNSKLNESQGISLIQRTWINGKHTRRRDPITSIYLIIEGRILERKGYPGAWQTKSPLENIKLH